MHLQVFWTCLTGRRTRPNPDPGQITCPIWPGTTLGSLRRSIRMWVGRGTSGRRFSLLPQWPYLSAEKKWFKTESKSQSLSPQELSLPHDGQGVCYFTWISLLYLLLMRCCTQQVQGLSQWPATGQDTITTDLKSIPLHSARTQESEWWKHMMKQTFY